MNKILKSVLKYFILFLIGGIIYYLIEVMFRGYSHWTMAILGGLCFISIGSINNIISWKIPLVFQSMIGMMIITILEGITGYIVNIKLGWNVWDYSDMPLNIMGQICLPFCILWYLISFVAIILDDYLRYWLFNERKPSFTAYSGK